MEVLYTSTNRGTEWLTAPKEREAHLAFLAIEVRSVFISIGGRAVKCKVGIPDFSRNLPVAPDAAYRSRLPAPALGTSVRIDYELHGVSYTWHSRVVGLDGRGRWLLKPPMAIERSDRRLVHRHEVAGHPDFKLVLDLAGPHGAPVLCTMLDISTQGVGFLLDGSAHPVQPGIAAMASLQVPGNDCLEALILVARVRPLLNGESCALAVGARFVDLPMQARMNLALGISIWEQARLAA